ncbi:hypothetical protein PPERSA_07345 [Pseudocohnilembus persalinus]|uniref:Transmembrane protein n=1 Tax=Pseudocohnilembus persalinus TaxID=266149 RepID=A0A0V0QAJ4_PSEPJ|nr:hypothetical protein PPERSA_07345 [Pseudocohnilembus persalinus]|eukprot:KRW99092.1 hypothetical protein PPERSA_07345 [Pseudocohnilembus persalinus]
MIHQLFPFYSLIRVNLQHFVQQIFDQIIRIFIKLFHTYFDSFSFFKSFSQIIFFLTFQIRVPFMHQKVQNYSQTENVIFQSIIILFFQQNFRRVKNCSSKSFNVQLIYFIWKFLSKTEIANFYSLIFEINICQFQISVNNSLVMQLFNSLHNLLENKDTLGQVHFFVMLFQSALFTKFGINILLFGLGMQISFFNFHKIM